VLALSVQNLEKTYSNGHHALKGINLDVEEGDFFALLGPNGAGKSTAIGIICSLVNKSGGRVEVFGDDLDMNPMAVKRHLGLVPQEFNFNQWEPVEEILINQAGYQSIPRSRARKRADEMLMLLGLWDKRRDQARELSGGMKRRMMIARALMHEPRLLILDEPTAGVDIEIRRSMWEFLSEINARGTTIILTTHYLEEAENLCRNIAIINDGRIAEMSTMHKLLSQLHQEVYVLNLDKPLREDLQVDGYEIGQRDEQTLEVLVKKEHGLTDLFARLAGKGIRVTSMRNKQNRLEQLFLEKTASAKTDA
jgi:ABC-2 type transport system ATP-binding protein